MAASSRSPRVKYTPSMSDMNEKTLARAKKRASWGHPCFLQPEDRHSTVWRYLDFAKFVSLLHTRALFFARSDLLGDPWEGAFSTGSRRIFAEFEAIAKGGGEEAAKKDWRRAWEEAFERERWSTYINCWQMSAYERVSMWERYCGGAYGVAIKTTFAKLDASLPVEDGGRSVLLGLVRYGDYDMEDYEIDITNMFAPFMSKRVQYSDEIEVRATFKDPRITRDLAPPGHAIRVDLNALVEAIVVSPVAPHWFNDTVRSVARAYKLTATVERSRLATPAKTRF